MFDVHGCFCAEDIVTLCRHIILSIVITKVGYKVDGPPCSLLEAALDYGRLKHVAPGVLQEVMRHVGALSRMPLAEKVAAICRRFQQEWQWSDVKVARTLSFYLPKSAGTAQRGARQHAPKPY